MPKHLTAKQAADALGIHVRTVSKWCDKGIICRLYDDEAGQYKYVVDDDMLGNKEFDEALFMALYTSKMPIAEVAFHFDMTEAGARREAKRLGVSRRSKPLSAKEKLHDPLDEQDKKVDERELRAKRLYEREQRASAAIHLVKEYSSARDFVEQCIKDIEWDKAPSKRQSKRKDYSHLALVAPTTDNHVGKLALKEETGDQFNIEVCRDRILQTTGWLLRDAERFGTLDHIVGWVGSDHSHIDNFKYKTFKDTLQDVDGTARYAMRQAMEVKREEIELRRQYAPVIEYHLDGNHDPTWSFFTSVALKWAYEHAEDVTIVDIPRARQYHTYGVNRIGMHHGDDLKPADLAKQLLLESDDVLAQCWERIVLCGHHHTFQCFEVDGVQVMRLSSLSGTDQWHFTNGYVHNKKAMNGLVLDQEAGLLGVLTTRANNNL